MPSGYGASRKDRLSFSYFPQVIDSPMFMLFKYAEQRENSAIIGTMPEACTWNSHRSKRYVHSSSLTVSVHTLGYLDIWLTFKCLGFKPFVILICCFYLTYNALLKFISEEFAGFIFVFWMFFNYLCCCFFQRNSKNLLKIWNRKHYVFLIDQNTHQVVTVMLNVQPYLMGKAIQWNIWAMQWRWGR